MKTDIRTKTALIVERSGEYLVGFGLFLRWSKSPWDAWQTRNADAALMVARKFAGNPMLFNPIAGQLKRYERG